MKTLFNALLAPFSTHLSAAARGARPVLMAAFGLLGAAFALPAHAQTAAPGPVQLTQPDAESLRLRVSNTSAKPIRLAVVHLNNGEWILSETHRVPAYGTLLKFNTLPSGRYALLVSMGRARYRYTIDVENKAPGATAIAVRERTAPRTESAVASAAR